MTERPWGRDIRSFMIKPKAERQAEQRRKLEEARQATERTFEEELAAVEAEMDSEGRRRAEADGQSGSDSDDELILKPDGGNGRPAPAQPRRSEGPGPWDSTSGLVGNHDAAAVAGQQNAEFEQQLRDAAEGEPQQPPPQHLPDEQLSRARTVPPALHAPCNRLVTRLRLRRRDSCDRSSEGVVGVDPRRVTHHAEAGPPAHGQAPASKPARGPDILRKVRSCNVHIAAPAPEIRIAR